MNAFLLSWHNTHNLLSHLHVRSEDEICRAATQDRAPSVFWQRTNVSKRHSVGRAGVNICSGAALLRL